MKLKTGQKCAFGFGAFGKDIVYMLIASYLLYYYNVVLGMSSVFIGTVMMAARIFDAFNDPVMGIIVAKTRTRWGRFRPWIFAGTVLNAVTIYALYATPESMGDSAQRVWLTVFYFAWGITYTLMDIPFWSMIPAITEPGSDREQLTSLARTCSGIGDAIPTVLTMTVVPILGAGSSMADYRIGFKWWALIIAVVFVISELVCVACVPERPVACNEKPGKISDMFKALFKNDQAMTVVVSIILVYTSINICGNLVLYFFHPSIIQLIKSLKYKYTHDEQNNRRNRHPHTKSIKCILCLYRSRGIQVNPVDYQPCQKYCYTGCELYRKCLHRENDRLLSRTVHHLTIINRI